MEEQVTLPATENHFGMENEPSLSPMPVETGASLQGSLGPKEEEFGLSSDRKQAEEALRNSEERYRSLFEQSLDVILLSTMEGKILDTNPAGVELFGYETEEEMLALDAKDLYMEPDDRLLLLEELKNKGFVKDYELHLKRKNGAPLTVLFTGQTSRGPGGKITMVNGILRDVSEKRMMEKQLALVQRLESVGRLAGGVAHDFNNLLTAILGYSQLMMMHLQPGSPLFSHVTEITKAADRAADLTRQLLAFSRKQVLQPKIIDLNALITENSKMLNRLIGEDIELTAIPDPDLKNIRVDSGQFIQVIMNLAINARDAMPNGGKLILETANVILTPDYILRHPVVQPGVYVLLAISDNGCGMDVETQSHLFEPFFTTKEKGKGTGLGLSTVYGIVKQSGGYIWAYSEPGHGTTFKIYMPAAKEAGGEEPVQEVKEVHDYRGSETILVVEDDEMVRNLACIALRKNGYQVLDAAGGGDALLVCERHEGTIHLVLTDVIMPKISGKELAQRLKSIRPEMKVVYMSGYATNAIVHHGVLDAGLEFIQKPFSPDILVRRIRQALDSPS